MDMMPEIRGRMMPGGGGLGEVVDGFFIRRSASPVAYKSLRTLGSVSDNKENIPAWGYGRCKRSPLPEWYPRTPLRDVTAIVNALSRRRQRAAACRLRNHESESSPQILDDPPRESQLFGDSSPSVPSSTAQERSYFAQTSLVVHTPSSIANSSTNPTTASSSEQLPVSFPTNLFTAASNTAEVEPRKVMLISIDEIEKVVMKNISKISEVPDKKATRTSTLLSMR